ncbi:MAG: SWIM zinc finger family protein [Candidatus Kariarchaeaceae archaeon]
MTQEKSNELIPLSQEKLIFLEKKHGKRFERAISLLGDKKVKKYVFKPSNNVFWIINGRLNEYLAIEELFCSCKDFQIRHLLRDEVESCYHLLAVTIAKEHNYYQIEEKIDEELSSFLKKFLKEAERK